MVGGDNATGAKSSEAAGERDERNPAASYIETQRREVEDPGDREVPLHREEGNPWIANLTDDRRAARLEGRKLITRVTLGNQVSESFYRVDRYRRFLENRGSNGRGIVQFWGVRATRSYVIDDGPGEWVKDGKRKLHTIEIGRVRQIK